MQVIKAKTCGKYRKCELLGAPRGNKTGQIYARVRFLASEIPSAPYSFPQFQTLPLSLVRKVDHAAVEAMAKPADD